MRTTFPLGHTHRHRSLRRAGQGRTRRCGMITDIYPDPENGALIICSDDSVWDLFSNEAGQVYCLRLAIASDGKVMHRVKLVDGDRWVTFDDLTMPLTVG